MITVHLSWFETVSDWFTEGGLQSLFDLIAKAFGDAFTIIEGALKDGISSALNYAFGTFLNNLLEIIFARFYAFLTTVLLVLDCIEDCFDIVAGIKPVYRAVGNQRIAMPLLNAIYAESSIQKMIAAIVGIGFALCMLCAILATAKSMFEMDGQQTKPVNHVIRQTSKAMLYFILIPLISSFLLMLSGSILNVIDRSFTGGTGRTTVARTIFVISSLDAIDTEKHPEAFSYNSSYEGEKPIDFGVNDRYRRPFFIVNEGDSLPLYANPFKVKDTFTFRGFDYVIGIGMGIYFNIVLGMVLFIFICRIFEVIVLLVTEPFFIAMMPLDDGEHFKSWSNLFMGKLFGGFGMVVAMRVYLMISASVFANTISFVDPGSNGATVQNYLIKLLFIAGGALGIRSMGPLITNIFSESAAKTEQKEAAIGARYGRRVASFQGKRMGKLLRSTGRFAGAITSSTAAATGYLGVRAAEGITHGTWVGMQKFGGLIGRGFSKMIGKGKDGQNSLKYEGGTPENSSAKYEGGAPAKSSTKYEGGAPEKNSIKSIDLSTSENNTNIQNKTSINNSTVFGGAVPGEKAGNIADKHNEKTNKSIQDLVLDKNNSINIHDDNDDQTFSG